MSGWRGTGERRGHGEEGEREGKTEREYSVEMEIHDRGGGSAMMKRGMAHLRSTDLYGGKGEGESKPDDDEVKGDGDEGIRRGAGCQPKQGPALQSFQ